MQLILMTLGSIYVIGTSLLIVLLFLEIADLKRDLSVERLEEMVRVAGLD